MNRGTPIQQAAAFLRDRQPARARAILVRELQKRPSDAAVILLLAGAALDEKEYDRALYYAQRAMELDPENPESHLVLGRACSYTGQLERTDAVLKEAVEKFPDHQMLRSERINQLLVFGRVDDARQIVERALAGGHALDYATRVQHGIILKRLGRAGDAMAVFRSLMTDFPRDPATAEQLANLVNYLPEATPGEVATLHKRYGRLVSETVEGEPAVHARPGPGDAERRLRVGFVSHDFNNHSVAMFSEPIIEHLPRDGFEVFAYFTSVQWDPTTDRIKAHADVFRNVPGIHHAALAEQVRKDRIDILVDLNGLTMGHRLGTFALRPAPVQATSIGYPCTTGLATMDWRTVDATTDPPGAEGMYTERLWRLDPCFLCYRPQAAALMQEPAPARVPDPFVFGSFNALQKISDRLLVAWGRILSGVPGSTLVLKGSGMGEPDAQRELRARAARAGLDPGRLDLVEWKGDTREHLALYRRIGLALDTFPYNGTTTTCEALVMGVPAVTFAGAMHAGRVGASLLKAVGLPQLVMPSEDAYVERAITLATKPGELGALREGLRERLLASPVCDQRAYARRYAEALRGMWRAWCEDRGGATSASSRS